MKSTIKVGGTMFPHLLNSCISSILLNIKIPASDEAKFDKLTGLWKDNCLFDLQALQGFSTNASPQPAVQTLSTTRESRDPRRKTSAQSSPQGSPVISKSNLLANSNLLGSMNQGRTGDLIPLPPNLSTLAALLGNNSVVPVQKTPQAFNYDDEINLDSAPKSAVAPPPMMQFSSVANQPNIAAPVTM
jgi:hypothetical protein